MAYIEWTDVSDRFPEADDIIATADRTALVETACGIVDSHLSLAMHTPVPTRDDDTYDPVLIEAAAYLAVDLCAMRRIRDPEEMETVEYSERSFTGTFYGHRAMGRLDSMVKGLLTLDDQVTGAETAKPEVDRSGISATNGEIEFRYGGGRFNGSREITYVLTISSAAGTVAGDDLTITVVRDNDEEIITDLIIQGTAWVGIEYGLQARFKDAATSPSWVQTEYVTITCTPKEEQDVVGGDIYVQEMSLG